MTAGWNPRMVTRDGEEIEPSSEYAGTHRDPTPPSSPKPRRWIYREIDARNESVVPEIGPDPETPLACPECGVEYDTRADEAACLDAHIRADADRLAADGDVLVYDGGGA